ncbi:MAG: hypothetical protein LBI03_08975 [Clostridiales bacterium]|nr:hypothetical protein [Clostridiales bacterium]
MKFIIVQNHEQFYQNIQGFRELVFCLDNNPPRREAAVTMARKYADKGYQTHARSHLLTNIKTIIDRSSDMCNKELFRN